MPALGMFQETGKLIAWLKNEGDPVAKGEAIMEVETDKATVEIEASAAGVLSGVLAQAGQDVPVGETLAWILAPGEMLPADSSAGQPDLSATSSAPGALERNEPVKLSASPLARRIAADHGVNLEQVKPDGGHIQKKDVLNFVSEQPAQVAAGRLLPASPKARRLAAEHGLEISGLQGRGPGGAVLAADVEAAAGEVQRLAAPEIQSQSQAETISVSTVWRVMAERITHAWTHVPHFYLVREANVSRLESWRKLARQRSGVKITVTDLLVKLVAAAIKQHPRLSARWEDGRLVPGPAINIGLAMAIEDGLTVPVIHDADRLSLQGISERRRQLLERANAGRLGLADLADGVFTISNLGMYGIEAFNAIINPPQAAILAVGRIAERVVALNQQPVVQPMLTLTLSCDHRVVDGARGAQFLQTLVDLIEEPLALIE